MTKALVSALNQVSAQTEFIQAEPWMQPDTIVVRGMGRKRSSGW